MPAATGDQQVPRSEEVFISYSRKDKEFVRRLDEELKRRDREAWVDWEGIPPGDTWEKTIYGAIEATHTFIFVLTPDSIASEVCGKEIAHAAANNKRLVPIVHRDVAADRVPKSLAELNWIFCRDSDDFEKATDTLISALDTDLNWVRAHTRLGMRAIEWDANGRNNSFVLRGEDLRSAERWLAEAAAEKGRQPTALQTEYIIASRKDETQAAVAEKKRISEVASRGSVSLARYSKEGGKNAQALAHLAQALRLTPENRNASGFTAAMLTQLSWHVPVTGSMRHDAAVESAQFSPDGQRVVTASNDNTARLWDAASGKPIGEPMKHEGRVQSAQFSRDGQRVVTASWDNTARLWDALTGKPIGEPMKHERTVNSAQFSRDGQRVVTASGDTARLWDAASGKPIGEPMKHDDMVNSAQFSRDGQRVVTASNDNTARLWDAASGKPIGDPMKHEIWVRSAQFSPDGQLVVTASDHTARLWDAASGKPIGEPMKHEGPVLSAQFSPDGQRVVTASDHTARLWDAVIATNKDTREDIFLLAELAEATGGVTLETVGQAENLKLLIPEEIRASWEKIAAFSGPPSKLTPLQRFMKWSVADRRSRTISPLSQVTVSEWVENRIKEGTVEELRAALQVDPANARVTAHVGRRLADYALKQDSDPDEARDPEDARDPDEARRARGEADFLTSRALKLAPENDEIKKLRDEVVKLLGLKTN